MADCDLPKSIATQHEDIVGMIERLRASYDTGSKWGDLARELDHIIDYVERHFAFEELEMTRTKYPKLAEHHNHHQVFLRRLRVLRRECDQKQTELLAPLAEMLETWFRKHEQLDDQHVLEHIAQAKRA